ncbi:hypothetical protein PGT21_009668 [Puccinia graminis f. sp. tritici]|uniref:Uncharacterized protein n=1 Tax=Puccinia graminis f. sp. tritici TaxID=56615 RepID=A0A5B0N880_PUCGR|nr:hypothetical protein PGT21_009668 [Puccinia graminis f. sp. tritici]KAA1135930.1 hypothetical protein PGTUg99_002387 [Puccinia graminis f. sp. tritici]
MISNRTETLCIEFVISLGRGQPSCASCEHCGGECRGGKLEAQYYICTPDTNLRGSEST